MSEPLNPDRLAECDGWDWEEHTIRRETTLIEHGCPHGVGHPNPGSARWVAEAIAIQRENDPKWDGDTGSIEELEDAWGIHGCDGCCAHESFPGFREAVIHAHKIIRRQHERILDLVEDVHALEVNEIFGEEG
jgi:hypothetical protein